MPLLLLFILVPIAEIGVFIQAGSWIGLWPTLGLIVLTAFVGVALLKRQGLATLANAQSQMQAGEMPIGPLMDGFMLAAAGALLLTPGFITDGVGFALLMPPVRGLLRGWLKKHVVVSSAMGQTRPSPRNHDRDGTIDADYEVVNDPDPNSPWIDNKD